MSLRLTAPSEDILGANYKITKIVASDYNPNIDSTITVTVTVKDVYDDPVENESVQVTCNIGKFTKLNGSTISDTQSVTGTTDSNGQFTLTYSCTEWGLATFSANNENIQIKVTGWKQVQSSTLDGGASFKVFSNGELKRIEAYGNVNIQGQSTFTNIAVVDANYNPTESTSPVPVNWTDKSKWVRLLNTGYLQLFNESSSGTATLEACFIYY